jgi:hypothetical protein
VTIITVANIPPAYSVAPHKTGDSSRGENAMYRSTKNARQRLVIFAICCSIYSAPVFAQMDVPTDDQKAAIQDLFKISAAINLCGYEMNARKVSSDLAQIDMTLRDVTDKGRFWPYVSTIWPSWWDELQKIKALSSKDVLCSNWAADYGESARTSDRRTWLQKPD